MNKSRSMKQEMTKALNINNGVRAWMSSAVLGGIYLLFILAVNLSSSYAGHKVGISVFLGVAVTACVLFAVVGRIFIKNNEEDRIVIYYRSWYLINGIFMLASAEIDRVLSGSMFLFYGAALYMASVPVFSRRERRPYLYTFAVLTVVLIAVAGSGARDIAEAFILAGITILTGHIFQENAISHECIRYKLRARTVTSERDPLTGLNNRRGINRKASVLEPYCMEHKIPLGLIEIDVDYFKKYNDRFGHPAGDECLKLIASAIRDTVDNNSYVTARTGGEEFMVFVQGMTEEEIVELALAIRDAVDGMKIPHAYVGVANYVTVSMGVAVMMPKSKDAFHELYEEADRALYLAKSNGRHCIVCKDRIYGRMRNGLATVINS